ncbi:MAG TPA: nucleotidyltransferase domain-containing protein [Thermoanaerobaculia bacterium]|jgi:predicted nucleotidyltransferase|nr:nucleotidyltransferase domain-containing protein [Thermoanaerobaculia bacterium]
MNPLDRDIVRATENFPGISVLAVFGSRARGTHRPDSDLDVAVLPASPDSRARRHLQADVAVALADLAPEGRVDVVLLDEVDDVLRQRIMETGRVLLNRDNEAWKELRIRTMREYGDREWARRLYREAQRRRLERGEPSGRSGKALESLKRVGKLPR